MIHKTICCLTSNHLLSQAEHLCADIYRHINVQVAIATGADFPIQNYDVILYVHSKDALSDSTVRSLLKKASDMNKIFLPVIIGGSFFGNLILRLKYNGPNLRTSFLTTRKRKHLFEVFNRIAAYSGIKLVGDPLGANCVFTTDHNCKLIRAGVTIAELKANQPTTVRLYYGSHKIIVQALADETIRKQYSVRISSIDDEQEYSIFLGYMVSFMSDFDCFVYQNKRLVGSILSNKFTTLSLLQGKSKIQFQIESSRIKNRYDHTLRWNGKDSKITIKLKKKILGNTDGYGISRSDYAAYRQMSAQREALKRKLWQLPPKEQKKINIEIEKIDSKLDKLKQRINKEK